MGHGIAKLHPLIMPAANYLTVPDQHRSNWNAAGSPAFAGFGNGFSHETQIIFPSHRGRS
jgi:hypothetical protein